LLGRGLSPTSADTLPQALEREGFEVRVVSDKWNKFSRLQDMLLTTYKQRNHIDLVIIDTYSTWSFYYAVAIAKLCRWYNIPYIPVLHGGNLPRRLEKNKMLCQNLFGGAITNVAPSVFMVSQFEQAGYTNLTHIPNAISLKKYEFKLRDQLSYRLLWVRSFSEIYNPMLALEVVKTLKKRGKPVSLCMVGPDKDGSMETCKTMAVNQNLPITFTGVLDKEEWIALSQEYDIFINTTNFDNMPVSVMEAMALGMPVVSTSVGGVPYLIADGKTGLLVPANNLEAFVKAIENVVEDLTLTKQITRQARLEIEAMDWEKVKKMWITLIDKVLT